MSSMTRGSALRRGERREVALEPLAQDQPLGREARDGGVGHSPVADRQRLIDRRPAADDVALDLERVGPRQVVLRPDPEPGDPLVLARASRSPP